MGAYICSICDNMFCSHEVIYYFCDKCNRAFCEDCWRENLEEEQDEMGDLCGDCFATQLAKGVQDE